MHISMLWFYSCVTTVVGFAFQERVKSSTTRRIPNPATKAVPTTRGATLLLFQSVSGSSTPSGPSSSPKGPTTIPVIGPLLNTAPLLIGGTLWLDPPTPLQWKTIEVCVEAAAALRTEKDTHTGLNGIATIDAAPLVAVVQAGSDVASIAAIVACSTAKESSSGLDTFDSTSLRESLTSLLSSATTPFYSETSKVRLLCIGRAKLSEFRAVDPTMSDISSDGARSPSAWGPTSSGPEGALLQEEEIYDFGKKRHEEHAFDPTISTTDAVSHEPVILARMHLLLDTTMTRGSKGDNAYGTNSSPVHALSQLSMWTAKIRFVHSDRQRLVQLMQAAQTRLNMLSQEWKDHDGIGSLFSGQGQGLLDGVVAPGFDPDVEFQSKIDDIVAMTTNTLGPPTTITAIASPKALSPRASRLFELDNYGLGSTASAYCDIQSMTRVIMELLQAYYSPERTQTEEFEYSLFSWVALQSIMEYHHDTTTTALAASNTIDRMETIYTIMMSHVEALRELVLAKCKELHDCGEECDAML